MPVDLLADSLPNSSESVSSVAGQIGDNAPIDRVHLERYTLGSEPLEREILGLFLAQLPLILESLKFAETDWDWQVAAHTLKGSARSVGATRVAELALEAEKGAGLSDQSLRDELLGRLEAAMSEVDAYVGIAYSGSDRSI